MTADFIAALFNNEPKARTYLAPDYDGSIAMIRQIIGAACPPSTFSVLQVSADEDRATARAVLRYPDRTIPLAVYLARRAGRWVVTGVEVAK